MKRMFQLFNQKKLDNFINEVEKKIPQHFSKHEKIRKLVDEYRIFLNKEKIENKPTPVQNNFKKQ